MTLPALESTEWGVELDRFIAAGLYDPEGPKAAERLELIEHWISRGFTIDELIEINSNPNGIPPTSFASGIAMETPPRLSLRDVAAQSGVPLEMVVRIRRALGFAANDPDVVDVSSAAVEVVGGFAFGTELYGEERTLALARIVGSNIQGIMEAARAMFVSTVTEAQATELEISQANELSIGAWELLIVAVTHTMRERPSRDEAFITELLADNVQVGVVFVDLVDSVSWSGSISAEQHATALARFEERASEFATERGGRVIKFIGDEVMIVARNAPDACRIAWDLVRSTNDDAELPMARGAVNFGRVTARDGDYFGPVVNVAARATKIALPGSLVVTDAVLDSLDRSEWTLTSLGTTNIRGIDTPVSLHAVDRAR